MEENTEAEHLSAHHDRDIVSHDRVAKVGHEALPYTL